jgi:translation initiation factor IF-2
MTDNKDDKTTGAPEKRTLSLKPSGVQQGMVRQDMGRGRTNTVVVETRKRRFGRPEDEKVVTPVAAPVAKAPAPVAPAPAPAPKPAAPAPVQARAPQQQQPQRPAPTVNRTDYNTQRNEHNARPRMGVVLKDLSAGEIEARRRALAEAQVRDAEDARRKIEEEARRKVEEEARARRLQGRTSGRSRGCCTGR